MQFPESWLREFCDPPLTTAQLADLLTMSGMEVEELRPAAPPFTRVVVGEIVECEPHPNADKLSVCRVQAGAFSRDGALQVVCGAPNAREGLRAPLALVGARPRISVQRSERTRSSVVSRTKQGAIALLDSVPLQAPSR